MGTAVNTKIYLSRQLEKSYSFLFLKLKINCVFFFFVTSDGAQISDFAMVGKYKAAETADIKIFMLKYSST